MKGNIKRVYVLPKWSLPHYAREYEKMQVHLKICAILHEEFYIGGI